MLYVKYKVLCWCVVCLLYQVYFVQCQLTSVTRNDIDSFRIGDGCKKNASACSSYEALCSVVTDECSCKYDHPHFRNPIIELSNGGTKYQYGSSYGCMTRDMIKHQNIDKAACMITPYQRIPHQPTQIPTTFNRSRKIFQGSCILEEVEVKYPNSSDWRKVPWLNNSFVEFTARNTIIHVKWKKSVPELQGLMITMWLGCTEDQASTITLECLQAKVKGTWTLNSSTVAPWPPTTLPTISTSDSQITPSESVTVAVSSSMISQSPTSSTNTTNNPLTDDDDGDSGTNPGAIAAAVVVPLIVLVVGIVVVWWVLKRRKEKRLQNKYKSPISNRNEAYAENAVEKSDYATPEIQRVDVNGDSYAVVNKPKPGKKNKDPNQLDYLDPGRLDLEGVTNDNEPSQPTEYATIAGVLQETNE